jgi:hypothetical protein
LLKTRPQTISGFQQIHMIDKLLIIINKLINIIAYILLALWTLLTIIVIFSLIHRWVNPGWKSISNPDLMDYGGITIIFLIIIGFLFFIRFFINKRLASKAMAVNRLHPNIFSLISVILSGLSIAIIIKINIDIAHRYLQSDGKTKALYGIVETLIFYYQYYFVGLSLIAFVFAILGSKRKEQKIINSVAYTIGVISLILIFASVWRLMV